MFFRNVFWKRQACADSKRLPLSVKLKSLTLAAIGFYCGSCSAYCSTNRDLMSHVDGAGP